jgi:hypothetical protein
MSENDFNFKEPNLETGEGCFEFSYDFSGKNSDNSSEEKCDIVQVISAYFKLMNPTYNMGDETELLHKDYFPVITSIKHIPRRGPQIHAPNDILEIRRAIIFKRFANTFPYPEEVIRIDRSKLKLLNEDVIMESFIDFGFKKEMMRLYMIGYLLKRQLLNPDCHKLFENQSKSFNFLNNLFNYKCLKECQFMTRIIQNKQLVFFRTNLN